MRDAQACKRLRLHSPSAAGYRTGAVNAFFAVDTAACKLADNYAGQSDVRDGRTGRGEGVVCWRAPLTRRRAHAAESLANKTDRAHYPVPRHVEYRRMKH